MVQRSEFLDYDKDTCFASYGGIRICKNFLITKITSSCHTLLNKPNHSVHVQMFSEFFKRKFRT